MKYKHLLVAVALMITCCLAACSGTDTGTDVNQVGPSSYPIEAYGNESEIMELTEEMVPLADAPTSVVLVPIASGNVVYQGNGVSIDASNTVDGYVMISYTGAQAMLKVIITGPSTTQYTYNLSTAGVYETFPLSDGNGTYKIGVYKNVSGTKYSVLFNRQLTVTFKDEFAPFLRPNQYVNYTADSKTVAQAKTIVTGKVTVLEKVEAVYDYVVKNLTYDKEKAKTVQSGYLPDVDAILASKKGICFDYSAVMAAMLRSQGVPTKLVVGYAGTAYHAWINVYSEDTGWVEGAIFFDGTTWKLMDPTFASSGKSSNSVMEYIGDGSNYTVKYLY